MHIGFDYWQVISHYPREMATLMRYIDFGTGIMSDSPYHVHIISAIGEGRKGTIEKEVDEKLSPYVDRKFYYVHEVIFDHPRQSPELKLAKCKELGIEMFFDDRADVCRLLSANGIIAMKVPRKDGSEYDLRAERK